MPPTKRAKKTDETAGATKKRGKKTDETTSAELTVTFPRFGTLTGTVLSEEDNHGENLIVVRWTQPPDGGDKRWDWKVPPGESYVVKHTADSQAALSDMLKPPHPRSNQYNLLSESPADCRLLVPSVELDSETTFYLGEPLDSERWWVTKRRLMDPPNIGDHGYAPDIPSYPAALYMLVGSQVRHAMYGYGFAQCTFVSHRAFDMNDAFVRHANSRPVNRQNDIARNELATMSYAVAEVRRHGTYDALWALLLLFAGEAECALQGVWEDDFSYGESPYAPLVKACSGIALVASAVLSDKEAIDEASTRLADCPGGVLKLLPPLDRKFEEAGAGADTWKDKKAREAWRKLLVLAQPQAEGS